MPTRHCVRCGPSYPQTKGHTHPHPIFGACLLLPNGWMDEDATWYGSRPRPRPHCTRRDPSSRERGTATPLYSAHVYCGHGRPSQLLLSSCSTYQRGSHSQRKSLIPLRYPASEPARELVSELVCDLLASWIVCDRQNSITLSSSLAAR